MNRLFALCAVAPLLLGVLSGCPDKDPTEPPVQPPEETRGRDFFPPERVEHPPQDRLPDELKPPTQ